MNELPVSNGLLVLPHLRIQNANAISSPLTWGFPAVSAFVGLMHALERKLNGRFGLLFDGVGVICHSHQAQITREGFTHAFHLTRNPVNEKGETAPIVEEGRIHLDVTLVFGVSGIEQNGQPSPLLASADERRQIAREIADLVATLRIAGGSVLSGARQYPQLVPLEADAEKRVTQFRSQRRRWLPGFALVSRDDLLDSHASMLRKSNPAATHLDAWLDLARLKTGAIKHVSTNQLGEPIEKVEWKTERVAKGWIVPIPVGYGALSPVYPAGQVKNSRDNDTPVRFVESLYSVGEWLNPLRLNDVRELLWYPTSNTEAGVYRCRNHYSAATAE